MVDAQLNSNFVAVEGTRINLVPLPQDSFPLLAKNSINFQHGNEHECLVEKNKNKSENVEQQRIPVD